MAVGKRRWLTLISLAVIVILIVGGIVGFGVAVRVLKGRVVEGQKISPTAIK